MKRIYVFSLLLACAFIGISNKTVANSNTIIAKGQVEISGQVKDAKTKVNMEFCNVAVFNQKDSLITGGITDEKGFFTIPVFPGTYNLVISFIGYKSDTIKSINVSDKKFLGILKLQEDATSLKEVTIKSNSYENKLDKDVQIVTNQLKEGTSNTKEVLDKLNGVDLDRYNNTIKVDNNDKVIILVDGMQKDQEYIKNLAPDRLKKIEIIRDPGGRYALEGYSAVISIILKKDYQGSEVFVSERTMQDPDAIKTKYIPVQSDFSASLNYTYNKINVYAKYNNVTSSFNLNSSRKREYTNGLVINQVPNDDKDVNTNVNQLYNNYTLGADYYLNPKHTISFESNLQAQPFNKNKTNVLYNMLFSNNELVFDNYTFESINKSGNTNSKNTLFYEWKLDENNVINSNFTYSNYSDKSNSITKEKLLLSRTEDGTNEENRTKSYVEFTHTFNKKTNLQVGYGNTWQASHSNLSIVELDSAYTNKFKYSDLRNKLYSYFSWQVNDKLGIKFGCAGETSSPNSNEQKHNYIIYQPYADIKYKPGKIIDFKLKYRASSNYPTMNQTSPFTTLIDQQTERTGNPYLKPEVTHKISLQTNIMGGLATIEPYFHYANNYITEIGTMRPDSVFEYKLSNNGVYKNFGTEVRLTIPLRKYLFLETSADFYNSSIKYGDKINNVNDWTMSSQLVYVNEKHGTVAGVQYQKGIFKNITAQGYNKWNNDFWITFVQQPFFKQKLSVMLLYFPPIAWGVDFKQGSYLKTDTYKETVNNDISILKNIVMLEISYRFNKGKSVNKKVKDIENDYQKKNKGLFLKTKLQ